MPEDIVKSKLAAMSLYVPELVPYLEKYRRGEIVLDDPRVFLIERLFQLIADAAIVINTHIITKGKLEKPHD